MIAFALIYWELDRGGPVSRVRQPRDELPLADLRFSHDEDRDTVIEVSAGSSEKVRLDEILAGLSDANRTQSQPHSINSAPTYNG